MDSPSNGIVELKKGKSLFETSPVLNEFATEYTCTSTGSLC